MTLNELNFKKLIEYTGIDPDEYSFADYRANGFRHPDAVGYCTRCEELVDSPSLNDEYSLLNISHGSHSRDFLEAGGIECDDSWNDGGVMFVMESPSLDYGIYETTQVVKGGKEYHKRPSKLWYWIHNDLNIQGYPDRFKGRQYGELVASAILTFKLSGAYMTNLIKCGLFNTQTGKYAGIDSFDPECVKCCIDNYLKKEIECVKPKVIFTFGSKVYNRVRDAFGDEVKVVGLPHPARQRNGFKDEYYNTLYLCMMAKWLKKCGVITEQLYNDVMKKYLAAD